MVLVCLWFTLLAISWANAQENAGDEEFSFNWLDPDKKISVLQNRKYLKSDRPFLSIMGGPGISNAYRKTFDVTTAFAYYPKDIWGIEVFYTLFSNQENNTFENLKKFAPTAFPVVREVRAQFGLLLHYVPWYAKLNVFNQILYFDWYFSGGAGGIHTALDTRTSTAGSSSFQNQDFFSFFLGTGHQYYLTKSLSFRIDLTSAFYRAPSFGNSGDNTWFSNLSFGFGFGLRI
ncbi:MAG: outer membrane beta-barrel domain-containing protein [Deltaproteobacteria bacterium]|nr:outer membrane beta-barrel domain-containing protein [Deltaproteobacteria bacterium]